MTNCRVCQRPLFSKPLLVYPNMPDRAQYLPENPTGEKVTLYVCQCSGCGLVQLDNEPVPYWREEISNATLSDEMKKVREERLRDFRRLLTRTHPDFTSYNRLEHQPDPNGYLSLLRGAGIIEVPNFDMMQEEGLFYEFILDHLMYFTYATFSLTLRVNGFLIHDMKEIQNRYILSAIVSKREPSITIPRNMDDSRLRESFGKVLQAHRRFAVYGASHQALTIIPMLGLQDKVWYIVDDTPDKQMKFAPSTRLCISSPQRLKADPVDAVIVMCGSYSHEVAKKVEHPNVYVLTPRGVERA